MSEEEHENQMNEEMILNQDINKPSQANNQESTPKKQKKIARISLKQDNLSYDLVLSIVGKNLKLLLSEQVNFPAKSYEVYLALDELRLKNDLFAIYNSIEELFNELSTPEDKLTYHIKKKEGGIIALVIVFLIEEENNSIEIDLNENIIDEREMFRQLFEKYKSIQHEQEEDIAQFMHRIKTIEEILAPPPKEEQVPAQNEGEGEEHQNGEEHEQQSENMMKEEVSESNKGLAHESLEIKSSQQESSNSIQNGKNVKKGKVEKKKEIKKESKKESKKEIKKEIKKEEKGKMIKKKKK